MLSFLSEHHPAKLDHSLLSPMLYANATLRTDLSDESAFFDQFDALIDLLTAQAVRMEVRHKGLVDLKELKTKLREKKSHGTVNPNAFYPTLKALFEDYYLLIQGTTKPEDRLSIIKDFLVDLDVCGPGMLSHKQAALAILKTNISYQAFLACHRERLIEAAALAHIKAKGLGDSTEIHVFNFLSNVLRAYHFTPYREVSADSYATQEYSLFTETDLINLCQFIGNRYIPSQVIRELAAHISRELKSFFAEHGKPFDLKDPTKRTLLDELYSKLGLGTDEWDFITRHNGDYVIEQDATDADIQNYIIKKFLQTSPTSTHTYHPMGEFDVLVVSDHFYEGISDAGSQLLNKKKLVLIKTVEDVEDELLDYYYFVDMYLNTRLDHKAGAALMNLSAHGFKDFSQLVLREIDLSQGEYREISLKGSQLIAANITEAVFDQCDLSNLDLRDTCISQTRFENCDLTGIKFHNVTLDRASFINLYNAGVRDFRGVYCPDPIDYRIIKTCRFGLKLVPGTVLSHKLRLLNNERFQLECNNGESNFDNIFVTEPLELTESVESCTFGPNSAVTFRPGTKVSSQQFDFLYRDCGVRDFTQVRELDLEYLHEDISLWDINFHNQIKVKLARGICLSMRQVDRLWNKNHGDFSHAVISGESRCLHMFNARYTHAHFKNAIFGCCEFSHCDFSGASFENTHFENCDLSGSTFDGLDFEKINLTGLNTRLNGTKFKRCTITLAKFHYCVSLGASFEESKLRGVLNMHTSLHDVNFSGLDLSQLHFLTNRTKIENVDVTGAIFGINILHFYACGQRAFPNATVVNCELSSRQFSFLADDLDVKKFRNVTFHGDISAFDLTRFELKDCDFQFARINSKPKWYAFKRHSFCETLRALLEDYRDSAGCLTTRSHLQHVDIFLRQHTGKMPNNAAGFMRVLAPRIDLAHLNPHGDLMQRIRFAITQHSCFDPMSVDQVITLYSASPSAALTATPLLSASSTEPQFSVAAGAGFGLG